MGRTRPGPGYVRARGAHPPRQHRAVGLEGLRKQDGRDAATLLLRAVRRIPRGPRDQGPVGHDELHRAQLGQYLPIAFVAL